MYWQGVAEFRLPAASMPAPAPPPLASVPLQAVDTTLGHAATVKLDSYTGPVNYLQHEMIWGNDDGVNFSAAASNVFLKSGAGNDALAVSSGSNVLDGGAGSNFLVGAKGNDGGADTFFIDGPDTGQVTWDTVVNFHPGDAVTLWGFMPGQSTYTWAPGTEGAAGYQGATLHAEIKGQGTGVTASITFAGMSEASRAANISITSGTVGGISYLYIAQAH